MLWCEFACGACSIWISDVKGRRVHPWNWLKGVMMAHWYWWWWAKWHWEAIHPTVARYTAVSFKYRFVYYLIKWWTYPLLKKRRYASVKRQYNLCITALHRKNVEFNMVCMRTMNQTLPTRPVFKNGHSSLLRLKTKRIAIKKRKRKKNHSIWKQYR